ncbi:MAG: hypothetical protein H7Z42_00400 [Roseiflexaceae bacterium]|nr:hypothetical protein [Roseiflexaceae bacterium]
MQSQLANRNHPSWVAPFLVGAGCFNVIAAVVMLAAANQLLPLLFTSRPPLGADVLRFHVWALWLFVGIVGVVLLISSRAPTENRGVMLLAALGKLGFVLLVLVAWLEGIATGWLVIASLGDVILSIGLGWAYHSVRPST